MQKFTGCKAMKLEKGLFRENVTHDKSNNTSQNTFV